MSHYATFGGGAPIATKRFLGTVCVLGEGNEAGCFEGTVDALKCCGTNAMERFDAGACRAGKFVERGDAGDFEGAAGWRGQLWQWRAIVTLAAVEAFALRVELLQELLADGSESRKLFRREGIDDRAAHVGDVLRGRRDQQLAASVGDERVARAGIAVVASARHCLAHFKPGDNPRQAGERGIRAGGEALELHGTVGGLREHMEHVVLEMREPGVALELGVDRGGQKLEDGDESLPVFELVRREPSRFDWGFGRCRRRWRLRGHTDILPPHRACVHRSLSLACASIEGHPRSVAETNDKESLVATIIAGYARTPFAKYCGSLAHHAAHELGAHAAKAALANAGVSADEVELVVAGQVLQAGAGQNPARQTAVAAGVPLESPAITVNAVCLSGLEAIADADRRIRAGEADVVIAVGQESMTRAPHVAALRKGAKFGSVELVDTMEHDGLTDAFEARSMGASTEEHSAKFGLTREEQDEWAARSHELLEKAQREGRFEGEIAPLTVLRGKERVEMAVDDGVRPGTTAESLGRLRPAFAEGGTITAGNASQLTDGAAALVLMSEEAASERGIAGIARILATSCVSGPDVSLHEQPARAIEMAIAKAERDPAELEFVEINEAFAAVAVQSTALLGVDPAIVNPDGGAIAIGHPIGASGARIVGHLALRLRDGGGTGLGAAGICGGGGQGSGILLEAL